MIIEAVGEPVPQILKVAGISVAPIRHRFTDNAQTWCALVDG